MLFDWLENSSATKNLDSKKDKHQKIDNMNQIFEKNSIVRSWKLILFFFFLGRETLLEKKESPYLRNNGKSWRTNTYFRLNKTYFLQVLDEIIQPLHTFLQTLDQYISCSE